MVANQNLSVRQVSLESIDIFNAPIPLVLYLKYLLNLSFGDWLAAERHVGEVHVPNFLFGLNLLKLDLHGKPLLLLQGLIFH